MSNWNEKRVVMQRYNVTAHIYNMRYAEEQDAKIKVILKNIHLKERDSILDVGCGTGLLFFHVASKVRMVVGLDFSRNILVQARKHTRRFPNVHLILADADSMPLLKNVFGFAFAVTVLQNMSSPLETLHEVKRVTKENAVIITTALKKKFTMPIFDKLLRTAALEIVALENDILKCHVAVCTKHVH